MKYAEYLKDTTMHFDKIKGEITLDMLNSKYSDRGITFRTLEEAKKYALKIKGAVIYPIKDYSASDIEMQFEGDGLGKRRYVGQRVKHGAQKYIKAYLVHTCSYESSR